MTFRIVWARRVSRPWLTAESPRTAESGKKPSHEAALSDRGHEPDVRSGVRPDRREPGRWRLDRQGFLPARTKHHGLQRDPDEVRGHRNAVRRPRWIDCLRGHETELSDER